jgi:hypothetical protein
MFKATVLNFIAVAGVLVQTALSRAHREGMFPCEVLLKNQQLGISMQSGHTVYRHPCGRGNSAISGA